MADEVKTLEQLYRRGLSRRQFLRRSAAFGISSAAALSFLVAMSIVLPGLLAALAWPFLKLYYISPRERLSDLTVVHLCVSTPLAAMLLTVALLDADDQLAPAVVLDGQGDALGQIAEEVAQVGDQAVEAVAHAAHEAINPLPMRKLWAAGLHNRGDITPGAGSSTGRVARNLANAGILFGR
jgi:hypothetical protein